MHIYQPPTQKPYWVKKVAEESYRKLIKGLLESPGAKVTMNVSGVLLELLEAYGCKDVIDGMRQLLKRGQLELTGSAKYHALLPFLPAPEIERQVKLNETTLKHFFGDDWQPRGFFPPEMAFTTELARVIAGLGYQWVIVDELSFPKEQGQVDYGYVYDVAGVNNFSIFFRERRMSWVILSGQIGTGRLLIRNLGDRLQNKEYLLTAMDGETFGHHRPGLEQLLFEIYRESVLETVTISELLNRFSHCLILPIASTWALMEKDLEQKKPFSRWYDEDNDIHQLQWQLTNLALQQINQATVNDSEYSHARGLLDKALHSDQYWWASARPWWSIEMIECGAKELYDAVLAMPGIGQDVKDKAKHLYHTIIFTAFDWQRSGLVDELAHREDEDVRQRVDTGLPQLPSAEVDKMVAGLQEEMKITVSRQEFERAAQIRDRIAELKRYAADVEKPQASAEGGAEWDK